MSKKATELFNEFINNCILNDKTLLLKTPQNCLTKENIQKCKASISIDKEESGKALKDLFQNKEEEKIVLVHALWFWVFADNKRVSKKNVIKDFNIETEEKYWQVDKNGIGSGGNDWWKKIKQIKSILYFWVKAKELKDTYSNDIVSAIINNICYEQSDELTKPLCNMLLYLCKPDAYEPIFGQNQKQQIADAFYEENFIGSDFKEDQDLQNYNVDGIRDDVDKKLHIIREVLEREKEAGGYGFDKGFSFWDEGIVELWNDEKDEKPDFLDRKLPINQLVEIKEAVILYGPPGTSKTYDAYKIAKSIVARGVARNKGSYIKMYLEHFNDINPWRTEKLQMHINYSYDDFIIGIKLEDGKSVIQEGKIYEVIEKAKDHPEIPYVLILDEINRTDISRVFGELFSAMEPSYRGKDVYLSITDSNFKEEETQIDESQKVESQEEETQEAETQKVKSQEEETQEAETQKVESPKEDKRKKLNVPNNLYFIGTMNEIDFSLEHIDFALRRRFIWEFKGFDEERLRKILTEKAEGISGNDIDIDNFVACCKKLNDKIAENDSLGKNYEIGHTFFADIIPIYRNLTEIYNNIEFADAIKVLWRISIKPMLEAYCGSMSKEDKKTFIEECEGQFLSKIEQESKSKKKAQSDVINKDDNKLAEVDGESEEQQ